MKLTELTQLDATQMSTHIAAGDFTAHELMEATLQRIEQINPELNAIVGLDPESALRQSESPVEGPFMGVPFATKDLLPYPGQRAAMGCRLFAQHIPNTHTPYTQAIEGAGLVCLGKTTSSELGLLGSTESLLDGLTRNPWGPEWSAGGSSGGAAAAVAAGALPFAHASDGGGSIRLPAALNGLFGFKPSAGVTRAAYPMEGPSTRLVADHCISRSVRDSARFLSATTRAPLALTDEPPGALRIGLYVTDAFGRRAAPEAVAAVEAAGALCERLGHRVEWIEAPPLEGRAISDSFFTLAGAGVSDMSDMLQPMLGRPLAEGDVEPFSFALLTRFRSSDQGALQHAIAQLEAQGAALRSWLDAVDVAICPTVGGPRPAIGHLAPTLEYQLIRDRTDWLAGFTAPHNSAGVPAMSVPLSVHDGLPVGVQFAASKGHDQLLFQLAFQLEREAPWQHRLPAWQSENP